MSTFVRCCKFNLVGAVGMIFQLGVLAALNRAVPRHYLVATAASIELTLLHNFIWHLRFTWRDRRESGTIPGKLIRFHAANGVVSMVGNLGLMRLLVREAHLRVLFSNVIAILVCSMVNFWLSHRWAFASESSGFQLGLCHHGQG